MVNSSKAVNVTVINSMTPSNLASQVSTQIRSIEDRDLNVLGVDIKPYENDRYLFLVTIFYERIHDR